MNNIQKMVSGIVLRHGFRKYCLILCLLPLIFISCKKDDDKELRLPYITSVDMEKMAQFQLSGYQLQESHISYIYGREYVYSKEQQKVVVTIGLHRSDTDASSIFGRYVSHASETMKEVELEGIYIGEIQRSFSSGVNSGLTTLVFIRKNALVIINGTENSSINLVELAERIDNDLQKNSTYVKRAAEMTGPWSVKVELSKSIFYEGDTAKVIVSSDDTSNEPLEYNIEGWAHVNNNVFTKIIDRPFIGESYSFGRIYHVTVMNKSNAIMIFEPSLSISY